MCELGERVQVYDTDRVQLYDAEGTLLNESGAFSGYAYGENGQTILYAGAWGEECVYLLDAQGKTVAGPFQSLSLLDMYEGTAYYSFMTFDTESTYSEELEKISTIGTRRACATASSIRRGAWYCRPNMRSSIAWRKTACSRARAQEKA